MGRPSTIDETKAQALHEAYQRHGNVSAAAREVGVSIPAAHRFFENTPKAAAPVIATQRAAIESAGASLFDTRTALEDNYQRLIRLCDVAQAAGTPGEIQAYVATLREIRSHIETSMDLARLLIDVDEVRKFQQAVLEAINEADAPTKQRIIDKLRSRRAVDLAL